MVYQLEKRVNGPFVEGNKGNKNGGKKRNIGNKKGGKKKREHRKQKGKEKSMKKKGEQRFGPWVNFQALVKHCQPLGESCKGAKTAEKPRI
jgi:hypothetical protein